jgi:hypothetical protein
MTDDPRSEDPETPAEPVHEDTDSRSDADPRADARNKPTDDVAEVIDDDRFQATDN